jgi:hypothetical protein
MVRLTRAQDLEQIEEWNEYGELKDVIASADFAGVKPTAPTAAPATLSTETAVPTTSSEPQRSGPPSRAPSERHISIAELPDKDAVERKPSAPQTPVESPMTLTMRQLGAEAAAKAAQKKTGTSVQPAKPAVAPVTETIIPDSTPTSAATKLSTDAAVDSPDTAAEATAAKTPAQLASEGATKTSVEKLDKIAESEERLASGVAELDGPKSTEEQQLEQRRHSSLTKTKSRLSEATPIDESHTVVADTEDPEPAKTAPNVATEQNETKPAEAPSNPVASSVASSSSDLSKKVEMPRQHRGSDIGDASPEEIKELEKKLSIPEEDAEDEVEEATSNVTKIEAKEVSSTDKVEEEVTKGVNPQETDAKAADKAGVSVGD